MDRDEWEFKLQHGLSGHGWTPLEENLRNLIEQWRAGDRDVAERVMAYGEVRCLSEVLVEFARRIEWDPPQVETRNRPKDRDGNKADVFKHDFGGMPTDETCESGEEIEEEPDHDKAKVSHGHTPALSAEQFECLKIELHDYLAGGLLILAENFDLRLSRRTFVTKNTPKEHDSAKGDSTAERETYTGEFSGRAELGAREDFYWQGEAKFLNFFSLYWVLASVDFYRKATGYTPTNTELLLIADDLPDLEGILQAILFSTGTLDRLLQAKLEQAVRAILNGLIDGEPLWKKRRLVGDVAVKGVKAQYPSPSKLLKGSQAIRANREILERYYPSVIGVAERAAAVGIEEPLLTADDLPDLRGFLQVVFSSTRPIDLLLREKMEEAVRSVLNELIDGEPLWTIPELAGIGFSVMEPFPSSQGKERLDELNALCKRLETEKLKPFVIPKDVKPLNPPPEERTPRRSANRSVLEEYYLDLITPVANRAATPKTKVIYDTEIVDKQEQVEGPSAPGRSMAGHDYHDLLSDDERVNEEQACASGAYRFRKEALQLCELLQTVEDECSADGRLVELLLAYRKCVLWYAGSASRVAPWKSGGDVTEREVEDIIACLRTPIELLIHGADLMKLEKEAYSRLPVEEEHVEETQKRNEERWRPIQRWLYDDAQNFLLRYCIFEAALKNWINSAIDNEAELSQWFDHSRQTLMSPHGETLMCALRPGVLEVKNLPVLRNRMKPYLNAEDLSRLFDGPSRKPRLDEVLSVLLRHRHLDRGRTDRQSKEFKNLRDTMYQRKKRAKERLQPIVPWFYAVSLDEQKAGSSKPKETAKKRTSTKKSPVVCDDIHTLFATLARNESLALEECGVERLGAFRGHLCACDQCRGTYGERLEGLIAQALSGASTSS